MKHLDELPSLRLQPANRRAYIPFDTTDKKHGAAIILLSPDEETSYKMMNLPYIYNPQYFTAYYMDRKVDTYINMNTDVSEEMEKFVSARNEATLHKMDTSYSGSDFLKRNIKFDIIGGTSMDKREVLNTYSVKSYSFWADRLKLRRGDPKINVYIHNSLAEFEDYLREQRLEDAKKYIMYSYTDDNNIHVLSRYCYLSDVMDGPYETYLLNELIAYMISRINPRLNKKLISLIATGISGQYPYIEKYSRMKDGISKGNLAMIKFFYETVVIRRNWLDFDNFIHSGNINHMKKYMIAPVINGMKGIFREFSIVNEEIKYLNHAVYGDQVRRYKREVKNDKRYNRNEEIVDIADDALTSLNNTHPELVDQKKLEELLEDSENIVEDFNMYLQEVMMENGKNFNKILHNKGSYGQVEVNRTIEVLYLNVKELAYVERISEKEAFKFVIQEFVPESLTEEGCRALIRAQISHNKVITQLIRNMLTRNYKLLNISKEKARTILNKLNTDTQGAMADIKKIFSDPTTLKNFKVKSGVYDFRKIGLGCAFIASGDMSLTTAPSKIISRFDNFDAIVYTHGGDTDPRNIMTRLSIKTVISEFITNDIKGILVEAGYDDKEIKEYIKIIRKQVNNFLRRRNNKNNFTRSLKEEIMTGIKIAIPSDNNEILNKASDRFDKFTKSENGDYFLKIADTSSEIHSDNGHAWDTNPINTLEANNLQFVPDIIRQLKKEGFKNIFISSCNPGGLNLPDDIANDPSINVTIGRHSIYKEDIDPSIDEILYELTQAEEQLDLYYEQTLVEDGIISIIKSLAIKAMNFIMELWKKIKEFLRGLFDKVKRYFTGEQKDITQLPEAMEVTSICVSGDKASIKTQKVKSMKEIANFYKSSCSGLDGIINKISAKENRKIKEINKMIDTGKFKENKVNEAVLTAEDRRNMSNSDYGLPGKRKYPMPDKSHVRAAIRLFNHVSEEDEEKLANAINRKIKDFDMNDDINVGKNNRFSKYYNEAGTDDDKILHNTAEDVLEIIEQIPKSDLEDIGSIRSRRRNMARDEDLIVYRKVIKKGNGSAFVEVYINKEDQTEGAITIGATPEARGKGLTDKLLQDASKECPTIGVTRLCWKCNFDNEHSYKLALRNGFKDKTKDDYTMYWLEKELTRSQNESTIMQERYIISEKDKQYNLDKWMHGKNILFITGLSGGGKSTLARQLASDYDAIYIELDKITHGFDFKNNPSPRKQEECWIAEYIKENNITKDPKKMSDTEHDKYFLGCMDYLIRRAIEDSNSLYVFEGIQVIRYAMDNDYIFTWPMIIKGTSMIKSIINKNKRQKEGNRLNKAMNFVDDIDDNRSVLSVLNWYMDQEQSLNYLRKDVKSHNEASFVNDKGKRVPRVCPKCGSKVGVYFMGEPVYKCSNSKCDKCFGVVKFREATQLTFNENKFSDLFKDVSAITNTLADHELNRITFTDQYEDSPNVIYRDIYRKDGEPVGFLDVYVYSDLPEVAQITAATSPEHRGCGYMTMLLRKLINSSCAKDNGIRYFVWNVHPDNEPSAKVAEKCGFTYYGIDNHHGAKAWVYATELCTGDDYISYLNKVLPGFADFQVSEGFVEGEGFIGVLDETGKLSEVYLDSEYMTESAPVDSKRMKKFLYNERIKTNSQQLEQLKKAEVANPWLKRVFLRLDLYKGHNLFIDMSYYHSIFLKNNTVTLDRGVKLYFDFLNKMINNKEFDQWAKKTIYIPLFPNTWGPYTPDIYDYKKRLNILSMIVRLLRKDPDALKNAWGNKIIIFVGKNGYFRIDFSTFGFDKLPKFKKLCDKLLLNQTITPVDIADDDDDIIVADTVNDDEVDSTKAIVTGIIDRIENNTGIKIDNVATGSSKHDSIDKAGHLRIRTQDYVVDDPNSTFIGILAPDSDSFEQIMYSNVIKNSDEIISFIK